MRLRLHPRLYSRRRFAAVDIRVNILYRRELAAAGDNAERFRQEKIEEFRDRLANPYKAAEKGWIDEVIQPRQTRPKLIAALEMLENKADTTPRKKHGNIPL